MSRKPIFDAVTAARGKNFSADEVPILDAVLDRLQVPRAAAPVAGGMTISPKGLALIKSSEGLRLTAYLCPANVATIGYGSTGPHVRMGMTITEAEAEALLRKDLVRFEQAVRDMAGTMTQGQYDALVSFAFNLGANALKGSGLMRKHLAKDYSGAGAEFSKWVNAGGRQLPGLVTRRAAEAALYKGAA